MTCDTTARIVGTAAMASMASISALKSWSMGSIGNSPSAVDHLFARLFLKLALMIERARNQLGFHHLDPL